MSFHTVLLAPNAFKESLSAFEAARAMERGIHAILPEAVVKKIPVADGGDGTLDVILNQIPGTVHSRCVSDPLGRPVEARFGLIDNGQTALIEMAQASGLRHLSPSERNPLRASSRGTGELIRHALDLGVRKIVLALGGSATVDGGKDALSAGGLRFLDAKGDELPPGGESLLRLARIDLSAVHAQLRSCEWVLLTDVRHPLCGPSGAAKTFGPQKGATPPMVANLEKGLKQLARIIKDTTENDITSIPGGGAAGGMGGGFAGLLQAQLVPGTRFIMDVISFQKHLVGIELVMTGEGTFDPTSFDGKATGEVLRIARGMNLHTALICGRNLMKGHEAPADDVEELISHAVSHSDARNRASILIEEAAVRIALRFKNRDRSGRY